MPTLPTIDLSKFNLPKLDLALFDPTKIDLTRFDLARLDMARFDTDTLDLAALAQSARSTARDAAYVMIGAGVLTAREVQIRGRAVVDSLNGLVNRTSR